MVVSQAAAKVDLAWVRGDTVGFSFRLKTLAGLAGNVWHAQIRKDQERHSQLLDEFLVTAAADDVDCVIGIGLPPTSAIEAGRWWWDLQSDDGAGGVQTWISGQAIVNGDVTDV